MTKTSRKGMKKTVKEEKKANFDFPVKLDEGDIAFVYVKAYIGDQVFNIGKMVYF